MDSNELQRRYLRDANSTLEEDLLQTIKERDETQVQLEAARSRIDYLSERIRYYEDLYPQLLAERDEARQKLRDSEAYAGLSITALEIELEDARRYARKYYRLYDDLLRQKLQFLYQKQHLDRHLGKEIRVWHHTSSR